MIKYKNIILIGTMAVMLFGLSTWAWIKENDEYSNSERRVLATLPELSFTTIFDGKFMDEFENYAADQFPKREDFRTLKSFATFNLFAQKDADGLFMELGHIGKADSVDINTEILDFNIDKFNHIYDLYLKESDAKVYFSVVPDKNHYISQEKTVLSYKHEDLVDYMKDKLSYMEFIDITNELTLNDYYRTDTHWKQEKLKPVAKKLAESMGIKLFAEYTESVLEKPFYGVYVGQLALPVDADRITYLNSPIFKNCVVTNYESGMPTESFLYDFEKGNGKDPYELFLSGTTPLITIENPKATNEKELIVFRDSFASSLMPLFAEAYTKITLVDIRYISSDMLGFFIDVTDQDVLFLYSSTLLNSGTNFK